MNMKNITITRIVVLFAVAILLGAAGFSYAASSSQDKSASKAQASSKAAASMSKKEKISYAFGFQIGQSFKNQNVDVDPDTVASGIKAGLGKQKSKLSKAQIVSVLQQFQREMMQKQEQQREAKGKTNAAESKKFLEQNAKKKGIHVTKSGLQYKIIKKGTGASPSAKDSVVVKYKGMLPDGTVFDASKRHGGTLTFQVDKVISGWTQALQMMHVGAKWKVWIPAELAYGARGTNGGMIGPNQALVFDIQLVKIEKATSNK